METMVGLGVLLVLVGIAAAILVKQAHYDPQVIRPTIRAQGEVQPARVAAPTPSREALMSGPTAAVPAEGPGKGVADRASILGELDRAGSFVAMSTVESFDAATLADKIDGRAEFYLELGFERLDTRRFHPKDEAQRWFEVFLYRMSSPLAAFAAWSAQRRADAQAEPSLGSAYSTSNALYFVRGQYYVEIVAAWEGFGRHPVGRQLAEALQQRLGSQAGDSTGDLLALLPTTARLPGTERVLLKDAFGFARLDNVVSADFLVDGTTLTLFLSQRKTAEEAAELARSYHRYLTQDMGADDVPTTTVPSSAPLFVARALGEYELVTWKENVVAGIHAARSLSAAARFLEATLWKR